MFYTQKEKDSVHKRFTDTELMVLKLISRVERLENIAFKEETNNIGLNIKETFPWGFTKDGHPRMKPGRKAKGEQK